MSICFEHFVAAFAALLEEVLHVGVSGRYPVAALHKPRHAQGLSAGTGTRDGWSAEAEAPAASAAKAAPVPDSWEDEA